MFTFMIPVAAVDSTIPVIMILHAEGSKQTLVSTTLTMSFEYLLKYFLKCMIKTVKVMPCCDYSCNRL